MQVRESSRGAGFFLAAGGILLISLDSLGIRLAETSSWSAAFWLGGFTALAMAVAQPIVVGESLRTAVRRQGTPLLLSAALQTASLTFFVIAINTTAVSNVVVILAAAPVLAAVFAFAVLREPTPFRTMLAIGVSTVGILIVVGGSLGTGRVEGDLLAVAAIVAFSANLTLWRRFPDLSRMTVVGLGGLGAALLAWYPADPLSVGWRTLAILAIVGAITGPAGRVSLASSTRHLPASQVGLFVPLETLAATGWAWLFLDEAPPPTTMVGGAVVLVAVVYGTAFAADRSLRRA